MIKFFILLTCTAHSLGCERQIVQFFHWILHCRCRWPIDKFFNFSDFCTAVGRGLNTPSLIGWLPCTSSQWARRWMPATCAVSRASPQHKTTNSCKWWEYLQQLKGGRDGCQSSSEVSRDAGLERTQARALQTHHYPHHLGLGSP